MLQGFIHNKRGRIRLPRCCGRELILQPLQAARLDVQGRIVVPAMLHAAIATSPLTHPQPRQALGPGSLVTHVALLRGVALIDFCKPCARLMALVLEHGSIR